MYTTIPESELIINKDGSIYHLNLLPEHLGDTIITVGDPDRVSKVSQYFDSVDFKISKREFITHTGTLGGKRVTVLSTGMGTDNIEILMMELDALVNIDLKTRRIKEDKTRLKIIRIGTSGSLQKDIPVDSLLASVNGIGLDTLMCFYELEQTEVEKQITQQIQDVLKLPFRPYSVNGSELLLKQFAYDMIEGNTLTCPGFYGPQGREIRLKSSIEGIVGHYNRFMANGFRLTNFEMETAGYYSLGRLLGHDVLSLNAIVANRIDNVFSSNPELLIDRLIRQTLERL